MLIYFQQVLENPRRPIIKWHVLQDAEPEEDEDKDKDKDKKKKDKGDHWWLTTEKLKQIRLLFSPHDFQEWQIIANSNSNQFLTLIYFLQPCLSILL